MIKIVNTPIGTIEVPWFKQQEFDEMSENEIFEALREQVAGKGYNYSPIDPCLYAEAEYRKQRITA
jgi:hypothetical protein